MSLSETIKTEVILVGDPVYALAFTIPDGQSSFRIVEKGSFHPDPVPDMKDGWNKCTVFLELRSTYTGVNYKEIVAMKLNNKQYIRDR